MKTCPKCSIEHTKPGKFCSRTCANSRGPRTDTFKKRVSEKLKGNVSWNKGKYLVDRITKKCLQCNKEFLIKKYESKKYCSNDCWKLQSGGYREGSGRAKTGYYKGIYCGSTYELVWVIYNIDHGLTVNRFPGFLEKDGIKYYPDFLINKSIIEIKGYEKQGSVEQKTKVAESFGYQVTVLRKQDLETEFNWVKANYQYKELFELYDGYKPNYKLVCTYCGSDFNRNGKPKTTEVFCSRTCAGKGHKGRNVLGINQYRSRSSRGPG